MEPEKETSSPVRSFLWRLAPLGILVSYFAILWHHKKDASKPVHPQQTTSDKSDDVDIPIVPNIPPTPAQYRYTEGRKDHTPNWKKATEITSAVSTAGLLLINMFLWQITRDSVKLTRQQLEGTMRAIVNPGIGVNLPQQYIETAPTNRGHLAATCVDIHVEITKLSIPDLATIGTSLTFDQKIPVLQALSENPERTQRPYPVTPTERDEIENGFRLVIQKKVVLSYNDGFGNWSESTCQVRWAIRQIKKGQVGTTFDNDNTSCDEFRKILPSLLTNRRDLLGY